ncbi:MAG: hypothetical protein Q7S55_01065 [Nanoarchaeota archaeon]|nr:hypothetical protein [Nanoarchaeota archaeon]
MAQCGLKMNWETYKGNNPAVEGGEGFWTDTPYKLPLIGHPIKGFFNIEGTRINAIGHVWLPEQEEPGFSYYLFDRSGEIYSLHETRRIVTHFQEKIKGDLSEKLIILAMDFRKKYPEYQRFLDHCMHDVQKSTEKR